MLRECIQLTRNHFRFQIETLLARNIEDLRHNLQRKAFDIVHISAHATGTGLMLEDATGALTIPPLRDLGHLLQQQKIRIAILNACYSLNRGAIAAITSEYTVVCAKAISEPGAIEFTRGFYDALGKGFDVPDAHRKGLLVAKQKGFCLESALLRRGEASIPTLSDSSKARRAPEQNTSRCILGIALDVSKSMRESLSSRSGESASRLESIRAILANFGAQHRMKFVQAASGDDDRLQVFVVAFGLRFGGGVVDMATLFKVIWATTDACLADFAEEFRSGLRSSLSLIVHGLAGSLLGSIVGAVTKSAPSSSVNDRTACVVVREAERLGDTTLTSQELVQFLRESRSDRFSRLVEHTLFGATPMTAAAEELQSRFARTAQGAAGQRFLLIISDGEPTDGDPRTVFAAIRDSGVCILGCFVGGEDVGSPRTLYGEASDSWPAAAKLMWEVASTVNASLPAVGYLLERGWSIQPNAKLFIQANHSELLTEFMSTISSISGPADSLMLPKGQ